MDRFTSFKAPADEEKGFFSRYEIQLFDYRIHSPPHCASPLASMKAVIARRSIL